MDTSVKNLKILKFSESRFLKPFRISFERKNKEIIWDCVEAHDSVSALIYHKDKKAFLFVKQFRPSVWYWESKNHIKENGYTYELCAGLMDKNLSPEQTIKEEIFEETGYRVNDVRFICSSFSSLGFAACKQKMYYAEVDDSMKEGEGGGIQDEDIEVVYVSEDEILDFIYDENKVTAAGSKLGILWFDKNIKRLG